FFFVQAEDGIRDFHVTGVQTCALPISTRFCRLPAGGSKRRQGSDSNRARTPPCRHLFISLLRSRALDLAPRHISWPPPPPLRPRSEERRVGNAPPPPSCRAGCRKTDSD